VTGLSIALAGSTKSIPPSQIAAMVGWQAWSMKRAILALAGALWAMPVAAETFGDRWALRSPGSTVEPSIFGVASIFWEDSRLATGERFNPYERDASKYVCASPDLPLGTMLTVYRGARMHQCRVADRGPAKRLNRVLDLPPPMARDLGITKEEGLGHVTIRRSE